MEAQMSVAKESQVAPNIDLSKEMLSTVIKRQSSPSTNDTQHNVLRVTSSVAQYNVSYDNPKALENLGKALAGSLDRDDFTYFDPESKASIRLGDVLVAVDLSNR